MAHGDWKDLMRAIEEGDLEMVRFHLRNGIDCTFQHPEYLTSPLFEAIRAKRLDIVKVLFKEGNADARQLEELTGNASWEECLEKEQHEILDFLCTVSPGLWTPKNVLVTGGNRGIGKAICQELLVKGHRVVLTCRLEEEGKIVVAELKAKTGNSKVDFLVGDLSTISKVQGLADLIRDKYPGMDVLVHNAGTWPSEKVINADGLEMTFMVNYMAPFVLTNQLLPVLQANSPSRIVSVNAGLALFGNPDIAKTPYGHDFSSLVKTYANSKYCNLLFMQSFEAQGVTMNAVHPGVIRTGLGERTGCLQVLLSFVKRFWKDPSYGAKVPVYLAVSPEAEGITRIFYDDKYEVVKLPESLQDPVQQRQWSVWSQDFLARNRSNM